MLHEHADRPQRRWRGAVPGYYIRCPVMVVMGTLDSADLRAERSAIVDTLPSGLGCLQMIEGAEDYPHDQYPDQVVALMLAFLRSTARA